MLNIENILSDIAEDKHHNLSTTSFKFKTDVWNFFQGFTEKTAVEFGTNKGQTTKLLSYLFKHVYTVNINDNVDAIKLNHNISNITYISNFDLYAGRSLVINDTISLFFLDAGHAFDQIIYDINRVTSMNCEVDCYILFDDYGSSTNTGIKKAVDLAVENNVLQIVKFIGHGTGYNFGNAVKGGPDRILIGPEGVITKVLWH